MSSRTAPLGAWLRALVLLCVFAGLNAQAFACPAAMAGMAKPAVSSTVSTASSQASSSAPSCHDMADASGATVHHALAPAKAADASAKHVLPACCGVACAPAVPPLAPRAERAFIVAPVERTAIVPAGLAGVIPSTEKPPPRAAA